MATWYVMVAYKKKVDGKVQNSLSSSLFFISCFLIRTGNFLWRRRRFLCRLVYRARVSPIGMFLCCCLCFKNHGKTVLMRHFYCPQSSLSLSHPPIHLVDAYQAVSTTLKFRYGEIPSLGNRTFQKYREAGKLACAESQFFVFASDVF